MHAEQTGKASLWLDGEHQRHKPRRGLHEDGETAGWTYQYPDGFAANAVQGHLDGHAGGLAGRASTQLARWTEHGSEPFVPCSEMLDLSDLWRPDPMQLIGIEEKFRRLEVGPTIPQGSNPTTPKSLDRSSVMRQLAQESLN